MEHELLYFELSLCLCPSRNPKFLHDNGVLTVNYSFHGVRNECFCDHLQKLGDLDQVTLSSDEYWYMDFHQGILPISYRHLPVLLDWEIFVLVHL